MHDTELSAALLYATASGFWHRDHAALTAPYVERYFDEILGTAALRSGWVLGRLAQLAYPSTAVSPADARRWPTRCCRATMLPAGSRVRWPTAPTICAARWLRAHASLDSHVA